MRVDVLWVLPLEVGGLQASARHQIGRGCLMIEEPPADDEEPWFNAKDSDGASLTGGDGISDGMMKNLNMDHVLLGHNVPLLALSWMNLKAVQAFQKSIRK